MNTADLITEPHLDAPDDFYEALIEIHRDLPEVESHALNARLVLLLANHIGSMSVLTQALAVARQGAVTAIDSTRHIHE